uniref:DNA mismatch repair protein S5 domain-containing protein n=1 Tax=Strigamia maritima TaxID=126957 RepID=T1J2S4_STRMM
MFTGQKCARNVSDVRFEAFVSSCQHESGRNQCGREFYYVNGQPFDAPKFVKVVSEAYHAYNKNRYPLVVLNLVYDRKSVEVNVTPDKRKVFLNKEKNVINSYGVFVQFVREKRRSVCRE